MYKIVFTKRASQEFDKSFSWYEQQRTGLGDDFEKAIEVVLGRISERPQSFRLGKKPYREALVKKFPFLIIFKINKSEKTVQIASVFHTSRNPKTKYRKS